jgi:hypothetical protein
MTAVPGSAVLMSGVWTGVVGMTLPAIGIMAMYSKPENPTLNVNIKVNESQVKTITKPNTPQ